MPSSISCILTSVPRLVFFTSVLLACPLFGSSDTKAFPVSKHCIHDHVSALLELKQGFRFSHDSITALSSWNLNNTNCCSWEGITCSDTTGHVIGLDLSDSRVSGRIAFHLLFRIRSLQKLNLAGTSFHPSPIPSGIDQLTGLTHLNLSLSSSFFGQIPLEISHLTGLISLDLSYSDFILENPNLQALVQNLSSLRELCLDGMFIGMAGRELAQALSSAPPSLVKLSLCECNLSGSISSSLSKLHSLSELDLSQNNLSSEIPSFVGNFSSLRSLKLSQCELHGEFPQSIFKLPNMQTLDLGDNPDLTGYLPEFPQNSSLQRLSLSHSGFSGKLPDSLGNLKFLTRLVLANNEFYGCIPSLLFSLPSLQILDLQENEFSCQLGELHNASTSVLKLVSLNDNDFQGPIPRSIFQLPQLKYLDLSANNFSGVVDLSLLRNLKQLLLLDLSGNGLSINNEGSKSSFISFPQMMGYLSLSSCNMSKFPDILRNQEHLQYLDLSNNRIHGDIPQWVWNSGNATLTDVNLSHNALEGFAGPLPHPSFLSSLEYLDLSFNMLQGSLPSLMFNSTSLLLIDLTFNNFSGSLDQTFRKRCQLMALLLNGNQLEGPLPRSLAHCGELRVLNLEQNQINDTFPFWLEKLPKLRVLNLNCNQFHGSIGHQTSAATFLQQLKVLDVSYNSLTGRLPSNAFNKGCALSFLDLRRNQLEGPLPRTLAHCKELEGLVIAENRINDTFPFWLQSSPKLRFLILQSNQFYGSIGHLMSAAVFWQLKILDISFNSFTGSLPSNIFKSWKAMIEDDNNSQSNVEYILENELEMALIVVGVWDLMMKKVELKYEKIPAGFAFIDLSNNGFNGYIPDSVSDLKLLRSLNMSYNHFTGPIPASIGKLRNLESLDLSQNNLSGEIPGQLADVTSLEVLNVSYNSLVGSIPQVHQFSTFTHDSFLGNSGLCGPPLTRQCREVQARPPSQQSGNEYEQSDDEYDWRLIWIGFGVGFGVGWGILYWTLALWIDGRRKFYMFCDRLLSLLFPSAPCFL